jgi:hypothetical protein
MQGGNPANLRLVKDDEMRGYIRASIMTEARPRDPIIVRLTYFLSNSGD